MAKYKRLTVGTVLKGKANEDGSAGKPYIKLNFNNEDTRKELLSAIKNASSESGLFLNLESKKAQIESLQSAVNAGKLNPEMGEKLLARAEKIPEFVLFEVVLSQKQE